MKLFIVALLVAAVSDCEKSFFESKSWQVTNQFISAYRFQLTMSWRHLKTWLLPVNSALETWRFQLHSSPNTKIASSPLKASLPATFAASSHSWACSMTPLASTLMLTWHRSERETASVAELLDATTRPAPMPAHALSTALLASSREVSCQKATKLHTTLHHNFIP